MMFLSSDVNSDFYGYDFSNTIHNLLSGVLWVTEVPELTVIGYFMEGCTIKPCV